MIEIGLTVIEQLISIALGTIIGISYWIWSRSNGTSHQTQQYGPEDAWEQENL